MAAPTANADAPPQQTKQSAAAPEPMSKTVLRKFISGTFGGFAQSFCAHPFDLIKSRVQSGVYPNIRVAAYETVKNEGFMSVYKGVGPPLAIGGVFNAVLFSANEGAKAVLVRTFDADPSSLKTIVAGAILGAPFPCAVLTPADRIKIQLQNQRESKATAKYKGMIDCAMQLYKADGIAGLYRGYLLTLGTRVVGLPGFFVGAELGDRWYRKNFADNDIKRGLFKGSCAGFLFWSSNYPIDLCKTITQNSATKVSIAEVAGNIYRKGGVAGFYRGFSACMLRAFPANSSVFAGIALTERQLKARFDF